MRLNTTEINQLATDKNAKQRKIMMNAEMKSQINKLPVLFNIEITKPKIVKRVREGKRNKHVVYFIY